MTTILKKAPRGAEWLTLEEAYVRRNEYDPAIRQRIIIMMKKERLHKLWMRTDSRCGRWRIERKMRRLKSCYANT